MAITFKKKGFEPLERQIERAICDTLFQKRFFFWKQTQAGYFDPTKKRFVRHKSPYVRKGVPDIILIHRGRFIGLEVKSPSGSQTPEQKEMEVDIKKAGGDYFVLRSVQDLENVLHDLACEP